MPNKNMLNLFQRFGIASSLLSSLNIAAKDPDLNIGLVDISVTLSSNGLWSQKGEMTLYFRCACINPHRTGIGGDERLTIYKASGIATFDFGKGLAAEEVARCVDAYAGTRFVFWEDGSTPFDFDKTTRRWIPVEEERWQCWKCGEIRTFKPYQTFLPIGYKCCNTCVAILNKIN